MLKSSPGITGLLALLAALAVALPSASGVVAQAQDGNTLTVQVLEESADGVPIPDFQVQLLGIPEGQAGADGQQLAALRSDDQGQATFTGLDDGLYQVVNAPYEEGRSCVALPSAMIELDDENPSADAQVIVQCGDTAVWQLALLALPAVAVADPDTP